MKAQHRKELQTNSLAAGMGRMVKTMKTRPQRRVIFITIAVLLLVGGGIGYLFWSNARARASAELWVKLDHMHQKDIEELMKLHKDKKQGLAARFQFAYIHLWEGGIKPLAADPVKALQILKGVSEMYEELAIEAKDDPALASEARYNIALARETLAVDDMKNLEEAVALYKKVDVDFPNTAHGKEAKARVKVLSDPTGRAKVEDFYRTLHIQVQFQSQLFRHPALKGEGMPKRN